MKQGYKIKRRRKGCVQVATSSDESVFFIATSSSTASSPIASESPGMPIASGKRDSRMSIEPNSSDAASTSQVRPKDAYFGGLMDSSGDARRIKKKKIQNTPTILRLRSGTTKGNKLRVNPLPKTVKLGSNPLHTEPVLQLRRKVKRIQKRHGTTTSENLWKTTWRSYERFECVFGYLGMFMNTTLRAAVHLGKDYDMNLRIVKNHLWNNGTAFQGNRKLVSGQTETTGISMINFQDLRWMSTS